MKKTISPRTPLLLITLACLTLFGCADQQWRTISNDFASHYHEDEFEQAMAYAVQARDYAQTNLGTDTVFYAYSLNQIAMVYASTGEPKKAETLYLDALIILDTAVSPNSINIANVRSNLADLYVDLNRSEPAIDLYTKALPIKTSRKGKYHYDVLTTRFGLAKAHRVGGEYKKAAKMFMQCLYDCLRSQYDMGKLIADISYEMGLVMYAYEKPFDSIRFLEAAKHNYLKFYDESHEKVINTYHALALNYRDIGLYKKAHTIAMRMLVKINKTHGPVSPFVIKTYNLQANIYLGEDKWVQAQALYEKSLQILEKFYNVNLDQWPDTLAGLAYIDLINENYARAESYYTKALQVSLNCEPEDLLLQAESYYRLAFFYTLRQQYAKAQEMFVELQAIRKKLPELKSFDFERIQGDLAAVLMKQGNYDMAETLCLQVLDNVRKKYDKDHPVTANWMECLATVYQAQKRYNEAEQIYQKVIISYDSHLGQYNAMTLQALRHLVRLYQEIDQPKLTEQHQARADKIQVKIDEKIQSLLPPELTDKNQQYENSDDQDN